MLLKRENIYLAAIVFLFVVMIVVVIVFFNQEIHNVESQIDTLHNKN